MGQNMWSSYNFVGAWSFKGVGKTAVTWDILAKQSLETDGLALKTDDHKDRFHCITYIAHPSLA